MIKIMLALTVCFCALGCVNSPLAFRSVCYNIVQDGGEKGTVSNSPTTGSAKVEAPKENNLNDSAKLSVPTK